MGWRFLFSQRVPDVPKGENHELRYEEVLKERTPAVVGQGTKLPEGARKRPASPSLPPGGYLLMPSDALPRAPLPCAAQGIPLASEPVCFAVCHRLDMRLPLLAVGEIGVKTANYAARQKVHHLFS